MSKNENPYGYCPICGAPGVSRERRPNGNDECQNGHIYSSKDALPKPGGTNDVCQACFNVIYGVDGYLRLRTCVHKRNG